MRRLSSRWRWASAFWLALIVVISLGRNQVPVRADGATVSSPFSSSYTAVDIGTVPGVATNYGGITFKSDTPNTLLLMGHAGTANGALYSVGVVRGTGNHITGFSGPALSVAQAPLTDGGMEYGPNNVLFYPRYKNNEIGEIKPGSVLRRTKWSI